MFLHVEAVRHLEGYRVRVTFDNSVTKDVDLERELHGPMFEPLRELEVFQQVQVNLETGTIEWPNGADFAPEFLFEIGETVEQAA